MVQHMLQALFLADAPEERAASAVRSVTASQHLLIANFPPHKVERLASAWEWMISNENVIFVSGHVEQCESELSPHPVLGPLGF